ncbi:hypothetical protein Fcan01_12544 [Folsomia candida]|uniref:DUF4806 domain-containing protein n=1 Tax=Folsomia candida TaxID=158441 RepID=A0A226E8Z4_FOLCA|nr:hypothetical protein Fcan01_12544 [Folsomia candida]
MNFLVVEFPDDKPKTVDVIPHNWLISSSQCYWPSRCQSSNLTKIRRAQEQPDPSWGKCKCRILGSFKTFEAAQQAAALAENTSDLEINPSAKRNISRRRELSPDSSDNDQSPVRGKRINSSSVVTSVPTTSFRLGESSSVGAQAHPAQNAVVSTGSNESQPNLGNTIGNHATPHLIYLNALASEDGQLNLSVAESNVNFYVDGDPLSNFDNLQSSSQPAPTTPTHSTSQPQGFQRVVLKELSAIKTSQKTILNKLESILQTLSRAGQGVELRTDEEEGDDFSTLPSFPLESENSLEQLDIQLAAEDERKLFVRYLVGIGGKSLDETVKTILKRIISEDLAIQLSYTGQGKNKKPFNIYTQIVKCITGATKKNKRIPVETEKTDVAIREIIMNFFRYSRPKKVSQESTI